MKAMADTKFPFLNFPVELRRSVYRHIVYEDETRVKVVSGYIIGDEPDSDRFYTIRDLSIFRASRRTRGESSAVSYYEKHFVVYLYTCIPPYGCQGPYGYRSFRVNLKLVRMLHVPTSAGYCPRELLNHVEEIG